MKLRRAAAAVSLAIAAAAAAAGCTPPLPEAGTGDALLYEARCGTCHRAFLPRTLTAEMWRVQVERMQKKYREAGMLPPNEVERERIMAYLTRNAGG